MFAVRRNSPRDKLRHYEAFFSTYTPVSCYWAGFIAADGNVNVQRERYPRLTVTLATKDAGHLRKLKRAARLEHRVTTRLRRDGRSESTLLVSGIYVWYETLRDLFNIGPRKSLILQPPPRAMPFEMRWHFVRGYFDGDGSAKPARLGNVSFVSGSLVFLEWVRELMGSHHAIVRGTRSWMFRPCGDVMRSAVGRMYRDSTSETRMTRKYRTLVKAKVL